MIDAPLSYKKIEAMTGVASSTANDIYKHAVKNAAAKRARVEGQEKGKGRQETEVLRNAEGQETEVLRNAEERQRDAKQWELEWDREQQQKKGPGDLGADHFLAGIDAELQHLYEPTGVSSKPKKIEKAATTAVAGQELDLLDLLSADVLDADKRSGQPEILTKAEKDRLVATVKRDFKTRRMRLVDIRREARLSHVSDSTVFKALRERGLKAYKEEFKFILNAENKQIRLV
jgi:hypothetical protein